MNLTSHVDYFNQKINKTADLKKIKQCLSKEFYQEKLEEEDISATARTSNQTGSPTLHQEYIRTRNQIIGSKRSLRGPQTECHSKEINL
ncbi:hypothetical protein T265_05460 [Opisthorchis viverrini]|uniref:Uncharacterized protein n=1 Tax=Opisthorchis viverrini TaxID=6198 RepID=A0A075AF97_OPIVI|nr:hypothetical protein T265_05460 [Opisthorchis viverrini]KER27499.1 hypothetical protein T265_05460 [Opisthorchis viverrini]